jgi:hypothetical protein
VVLLISDAKERNLKQVGETHQTSRGGSYDSLGTTACSEGVSVVVSCVVKASVAVASVVASVNSHTDWGKVEKVVVPSVDSACSCGGLGE